MPCEIALFNKFHLKIEVGFPFPISRNFRESRFPNSRKATGKFPKKHNILMRVNLPAEYKLTLLLLCSRKLNVGHTPHSPESEFGLLTSQFRSKNQFKMAELASTTVSSDKSDCSPGSSRSSCTTGAGSASQITTKKCQEVLRNAQNKESVWFYFLKEDSGNSAKCKDDKCQKILSTGRGSTKGLHEHLSRIHNIDLLKKKNKCSDSADTGALRKSLI
jgi:BED zinc finger